MSIATALLRASFRSVTGAGAAPCSGSTSQIFVRAFAKHAEPPSSGKKPSSDDTEAEGETSVSAVKEPASSRSGPTSAFDIDTAVSDLVALQEKRGGSASRTGAKSRGSSPRSAEKKRTALWRVLGVGSVIGSGFIINNLGREWETIEERTKHANDPALDNFFDRFKTRLSTMYGSLQAPAWEKALPDPLPFPYQRPYTLVLDLDDLLIHSEWSRAHAWRTAKRPGLDYFLGYLSQWYEIVIFTKQPYYIVAPILEKLDPDRRFIAYQLFRESCRTMDNGQVVKDLSTLNRDLSKVIALDIDADSLKLQPENCIVLNKWEGKADDKDLIGMVEFLEAIGIYNVEDVRQTIKAYQGDYIPTEYVKRQAELKIKNDEDWKQKHQSRSSNSWLGGLASSTSKADIPKSWYDRERERFQQGYMEDQKYWRENGDAVRQQLKDDQEKQLKEMKLNAWGFLTGQGMKPAGPETQQ
ncbi:hypothetical protein CBS101457_000947 [Exobasidium rhododendri]|nr:hypothetical protein CBS101457_000947 [Exobasidium rhododendri]